MKVSGREAFSPRPLGDDGRKPLLCVISDQSRSPNAAYCHFKVVVHPHTTLVKCPHSCSCSCSPEKEFFSFFLFGKSNIQPARALHFSRLKFECQLRFEGSRRRRRPSSLPRSCDFVTLRLPPSQRGALTLSSSPPLIIILSPVNLQVRC